MAFVFLGSAAGIPNGGPIPTDCSRQPACLPTDQVPPATQLKSNQISGLMGASVAGAIDINGDGFSDVIVGASRYDAGETDEGAVFIFLGSAAGIPNGDPTTAAIQLESNQTSAWLGTSVAAAGDVNGDGADDVIVSAPVYDGSKSRVGAAFVFLSEPVLVNTPEPTFITGLAAGMACLAILAQRRRRGKRAA
jgi:hypothetical protein